jgi:hypothetical protein
VVFLAKNDHKIRVDWKSNQEVSIECETCTQSQIFKAETRWKNIAIQYRR